MLSEMGKLLSDLFEYCNAVLINTPSYSNGSSMFCHSAVDMKCTTLHAALVTLICALVLTKIDYCNLLLADALKSLLWHLQSIVNSAARLIFRAGKYEHVTPLIVVLHWLNVPERITF